MFKRNHDEFTLRCLLPGGWLTGDVINFFCGLWQPPLSDRVAIFKTGFWTVCLGRLVEKPHVESLKGSKLEAEWEHVFQYRVGGDRRVRIYIQDIYSLY